MIKIQVPRQGDGTDQTVTQVARIGWMQKPLVDQNDGPSAEQDSGNQHDDERDTAEEQERHYALHDIPSTTTVEHMEHYISALVSCALASTFVVRPLGFCMRILRENAGPGEHINGLAFSRHDDFSISCSSPLLAGGPGTQNDYLPVSQARHFWQHDQGADRMDRQVVQKQSRWNRLKKSLHFKAWDLSSHPNDLESGRAC